MMGEKNESVRGEGLGAGSSVRILSDLNSSGSVRALSPELRARAAWLAGIGGLAVGIAAGGVWIWRDGADPTDAKGARAVMIRQGVRQGLERRVEADLPRVERGPHMKSPVPSTPLSSVRGAGVVGPGTDREGSPMPSGDAKSVVAGAEGGREVSPADGRLSTNATVRWKESHRVSVPRPGVWLRGKKKATRRSAEAGRLPAKRQEVNVAGGPVTKPGPTKYAPRSERDVDIITAIVK